MLSSQSNTKFFCNAFSPTTINWGHQGHIASFAVLPPSCHRLATVSRPHAMAMAPSTPEPATSDAPFRYMDLPTSITRHIASLLTRHDLSSLSLTCRAIRGLKTEEDETTGEIRAERYLPPPHGHEPRRERTSRYFFLKSLQQNKPDFIHCPECECLYPMDGERYIAHRLRPHHWVNDFSGDAFPGIQISWNDAHQASDVWH